MKFKSMCETHWEWISCVMHDCVTGNFFFLLKLYHTNIYLNMLHIYCSINCWHRTRNWWNFAWTICAAPHFSHEVRNILKVTFPNQWTGKARSHTHTHTHTHTIALWLSELDWDDSDLHSGMRVGKFVCQHMFLSHFLGTSHKSFKQGCWNG